MQINQKFTQMRNVINEREDKLLLEIDNKFNNLIFKEDNDLIKKSQKFPKIVKNSLEQGKKINEGWNNNNEKLNSKINECIKIENSVKIIKELEENIKKYNSQKIEIKFITQTENDFKDIITKINEFGKIINKDEINKFKFRNGENYNLSENGLIVTKNSGGSSWNCTIFGDKEIQKNKISKWKIRLNEINSGYITIGIGPLNPSNKTCFYNECWSFLCYDSHKIIKSSSQSDYNNHNGKLKNGDRVEVIVDRISGNLSFTVNDNDYGIACSDIQKNDILYPVVMLHDQNQKVELI